MHSIQILRTDFLVFAAQNSEGLLVQEVTAAADSSKASTQQLTGEPAQSIS